MKHFTLPKDGGLLETNLPGNILHSYENIVTEIYPDSTDASDKIADIIIKSVNDFTATNPGRKFKLGLTTGASPVSLYKWLTRRYNEGKISFKNIEVFSIDEFYPIVNLSEGRNRRLFQELLDLVDIPKENIHIPLSTDKEDKVTQFCSDFEKISRGLDLLVIGVGEHGEIGFNEAGASEKSRTRTVRFSYQSRKRQANNNFNGNIKHTPETAITIGVDTMMSAKRIILMAWGEEKAEAVKAIVEDGITPAYPASFLQKHDNITLFADETASSLLTRIVSPWLVGPCIWTPKFVRKAVIWLCQTVHKPILKLTQKDYLENSLGELLETRTFDKINIDVFNDLQHTITGWPGGKPGSREEYRPVKASPYPKTVLIFSPHPDDDVISMGGTFIRLVEQGHNVHVAYQTSGDLAVHDDVVLQHMDAAMELGFGDRFDEVKALIESKRPGMPEPKELLKLKGAIRRSEAKSADRSFGLDDKRNVHFLNLPFYESGGVAKLPRTQADLDIIKALLRQLKPDQIYMAGDLADPHGTHRVCTEAALESIEQLKEEGEMWLEKTNIWLYRGAWMEWELGRVDMAVPLSPDELIKKRHAIFRHLSQKDIVPFPGDDPREFWQRAEERTQNTARLYDELGMAEYQAMEVFLRLC